MKKLLIASLLVSSICTPAFAANNIVIKDSSGTNTTVCTRDIGGAVHSHCNTLLDSTGAEVNDTTAHAVKTAPQATENHLGEVGGRTTIAGATFTTTSATTAWTAGQLIANSATNTSVVPLSFTVCRVNAGSGMVRRARIKFASDTGFVGASVILYLYKDTPATITNGDRGAWYTSESNYIGKIPVVLNNHFTDYEKGVGVPTDSSGNVGEINFDCGAGVQTIFGLLAAGGTITPVAGSKTVSVVLETISN